MLDFEVKRFTRRCASSDRELRSGETFYSVLVSDGADVVRRDYASETWKGPPEDCLGWWKSEVPDPKNKKVQWAPNQVMLHYFEELSERPEKAQTRYVLTLLLLRRKVFRFVDDADEVSAESSDADEEGGKLDVMRVYCPSSESTHEIEVATPNATKAAEIQRELAELLFAKA